MQVPFSLRIQWFRLGCLEKNKIKSKVKRIVPGVSNLCSFWWTISPNWDFSRACAKLRAAWTSYVYRWLGKLNKTGIAKHCRHIKYELSIKENTDKLGKSAALDPLDSEYKGEMCCSVRVGHGKGVYLPDCVIGMLFQRVKVASDSSFK